MQRSTLSAIAAAALFAGAAGVQSAEASSTFVRSAPVAGTTENGQTGLNAIIDDPQLANRVFNSLNVVVPAGQDWTNSEIRIVLTSGTAYNAVSNPDVDTESEPTPALFGAAGNRQGAFDTFVNSKAVSNRVRAATVLGKLNPDNTAGPPPALGLSGSNSNVVSVAWGNTTGGEDGTFQIGQFTLSSDAVGQFFGRTFSTDQPGGAFHTFGGPIVAGVMTPEPTGIASLLVVGGGLLLRRRRKA